MKPKVPNLISKLKCTTNPNQKFPNFIMKKLILLLVFTFFCANTFSQEIRVNNDLPLIYEQDDFLANFRGNQRITSSTNTTSNSEFQNIENLLFKIQSSTYYYSGTVKTYGDNPKCLFTDTNSLTGIINANMLKNNIEIITIKVSTANDMNTIIDLSLFSSFTNLKYVKILINIDTTVENVSNMIRNNDNSFKVFYKIEKES